MTRLSQVGIAIAALGAMIALMGLFPGFTGLFPTPGIGLVQLFGILTGFTLLILGAMMYVKFAFYARERSTLVQQIGTRLALSGLVLAALAGLADSLGFGSHGSEVTPDTFLGPLQALGIIFSYMISCIGVLIYAVSGQPGEAAEETDTTISMPPVDESFKSSSLDY
ncbi:MAG: hypothetical protein OHK0046_19670 [Anaerolineae bacterium]